MSNLREKIIRLANEHPETRKHLMPIIKKGEWDPRHGWPKAEADQWVDQATKDLNSLVEQFVMDVQKSGKFELPEAKRISNHYLPKIQKYFAGRLESVIHIDSDRKVAANDLASVMQNRMIAELYDVYPKGQANKIVAAIEGLFKKLDFSWEPEGYSRFRIEVVAKLGSVEVGSMTYNMLTGEVEIRSGVFADDRLVKAINGLKGV
jgi:hypothetical protein